MHPVTFVKNENLRRRKLLGKTFSKFKTRANVPLAELVLFRCSHKAVKKNTGESNKCLLLFTEHCKRRLRIKVVRALLSSKTTAGSTSAIRNHHRALVSSPVASIVKCVLLWFTMSVCGTSCFTLVQHVLLWCSKSLKFKLWCSHVFKV